MSSSEERDVTDEQNPSTSGEKAGQGDKEKESIECAVCLQPCVQPVQLPCKHIFCYLCVKGVTHQSKRCAMCRQEIPANYLDNPCLIPFETTVLAFEGSYQWFYEGKSGWWQYDERTSSEIEAAYKAEKKQCEVLIAGFLYVIDFENNIQYRRCDPFRRRRIKRDVITAPKKGVAGIRLPTSKEESPSPNLQCLNLADKKSDNNDGSSSTAAASVASSSDSSSQSNDTPDVPAKRQ